MTARDEPGSMPTTNLAREGRMKMLVVVEELPCAGRNGYSTYNRAFLDCFLAAGHELHVCVTGPRLDGLAFRPARLFGSDRPVFHFLHAREAGPLWFASTGPALARGANASLPGFLRRAASRLGARPAGGPAVVIGRRLAPRESAAVAALVDRIGPDWVFVDTIFRAGFIALLRSSPRLGLRRPARRRRRHPARAGRQHRGARPARASRSTRCSPAAT